MSIRSRAATAGVVLALAACGRALPDREGRPISGGRSLDAPSASAAAESPAADALSAKSAALMAQRSLGVGNADAMRNDSGGARDGVVDAAPMLIRTGQATMQVDSLTRGLAALRALAARTGGYVGGLSMQNEGQETRAATLELRIPSARFDEVLTGLKSIGTLESMTTQAQDVGEEYVDLDARMTNARKLEQRLIGILGTRTGKLRDVLDVERELARVREEIERYEGRMRYLRARAAMSSFTVSVHEARPLVGEYRGSAVLAEAARAAWRNFVGSIASGIAGLGSLLPAAVVLGALVALVLRIRRRRASPTPKQDDPPQKLAA